MYAFTLFSTTPLLSLLLVLFSGLVLEERARLVSQFCFYFPYKDIFLFFLRTIKHTTYTTHSNNFTRSATIKKVIEYLSAKKKLQSSLLANFLLCKNTFTKNKP